jgi:hypothetical protein
VQARAIGDVVKLLLLPRTCPIELFIMAHFHNPNHNHNHHNNNNHNNICKDALNNHAKLTSPLAMQLDYHLPSNPINCSASAAPPAHHLVYPNSNNEDLSAVNYFHNFTSSLYKPRYSASKIDKKLNACKLKHRTSLQLSDWQRYNYHSSFPKLKLEMYANMPKQHNKSIQNGSNDANLHNVSSSVDRIHTREFSPAAFIQLYEAPKIPVIIQGLTNNWAAMNWSLERLARSPYKDCLFKCGEDDEGQHLFNSNSSAAAQPIFQSLTRTGFVIFYSYIRLQY